METPNVGLTINERLDLEFLKRSVTSAFGLILWSFISLLFEFNIPNCPWYLKSLTLVVGCVALIRLFYVKRNLTNLKKIETFRKKRLNFLKYGIFPLTLIVGINNFLLFLTTGFHGSLAMAVDVSVALIAFISVTALSANLPISIGVTSIHCLSAVLSILCLWLQTGERDLLLHFVGWCVIFIYVLRQAIDLHKLASDNFQYGITLEQANEELRENRSRLIEETAKAQNAAKLAALGEMAGGVAHEINNPIAIILLITAQLKKSLQAHIEDPEKNIKWVEKVEVTAERISKIVRGLRAFSRNADNDPFEQIDVETLCNQVIEISRGRFYDLRIDIQVNHENPKALVQCRSVQISQVLVNLLNNSIDAISGKSSPWIRIKTREIGEQIEFRVADSGVKISTEIAEKIFNPFFTTKEVGKGTGIGLSISLGLVKQHHGSIYLDTDELTTTFVMLLPKRFESEKLSA